MRMICKTSFHAHVLLVTSRKVKGGAVLSASNCISLFLSFFFYIICILLNTFLVLGAAATL